MNQRNKDSKIFKIIIDNLFQLPQLIRPIIPNEKNEDYSTVNEDRYKVNIIKE